MASIENTNLMDSIFQILPESLSSPQLKKQLSALQKQMDGVLFLDETGELAVDRDAFLAFVNNGEFVPPEIKDYATIETAKHLGRRIKRKKGRSLRWVEAVKFGLPAPEFSRLKQLNLTTATQAQAISALIREWPDFLTEEFLTQDPRAALTSMLANLKTNRTPWDCIVANLTWWTALAVIFVFALVGAMILGGSTFWAIVAAAAVLVGMWAAYIILQCALNPEYNIFR